MTAGQERSDPGKDTAGQERSDPGKDTAGQERSDPGKDTAGQERSDPGKDTAGQERSDPGKDTAGQERSDPGKDTAGQERSDPGKDTAGQERSDPGKDTAGQERSDPGKDTAGQERSDPGKDTASRPSQRTLAIIPTYNERENLPLIVDRMHKALPDVHILVVDDSSPDGTGDHADELALADPDRMHVMHRTAKGGLGAAYLAGFAWGLGRGYSVLVEMDADGSHAPEELQRLLDAVDAGADLAIGSRYVAGGEVRNWPKRRLVLSRTANWYSRTLLGTDVRDITAGYRAYRREVLEKIDLDLVDSKGYCFQIDLTWRTLDHGFTVVEVPITFVERELGVSKMSGSNIREALVKVARWGIRGRVDRLRGVAR